MRVLFVLGWLLLAAAFAAAAAESGARAVLGDAGAVVPAYDLMHTLAPGRLAAARQWVEAALHPALWPPLESAARVLPAWLAFGGPGVLLAWFCRPGRGKPSDIDEDSLFLYDRLAERAREEGYTDGDDRAPSHDDRPWPEDWDGVVEIGDDGLERVRPPAHGPAPEPSPGPSPEPAAEPGADDAAGPPPPVTRRPS